MEGRRLQAWRVQKASRAREREQEVVAHVQERACIRPEGVCRGVSMPVYSTVREVHNQCTLAGECTPWPAG